MILPKYLQEKLNLDTNTSIIGVEAFANKLTSKDELIDLLYCFEGLAYIFEDRGLELFGIYSVYLEGDGSLTISEPTYLNLTWEISKNVLLDNKGWSVICQGLHLIYLHEVEEYNNYSSKNQLYLTYKIAEVKSGSYLIPEKLEDLDYISGDSFELEITIKYKDLYFTVLHVRENCLFYVKNVIHKVVELISVMFYDVLSHITITYNLEVYSKAKLKAVAFKNKILF